MCVCWDMHSTHSQTAEPSLPACAEPDGRPEGSIFSGLFWACAQPAYVHGLLNSQKHGVTLQTPISQASHTAAFPPRLWGWSIVVPNCSSLPGIHWPLNVSDKLSLGSCLNSGNFLGEVRQALWDSSSRSHQTGQNKSAVVWEQAVLLPLIPGTHWECYRFAVLSMTTGAWEMVPG